jgi:hypothetical protein
MKTKKPYSKPQLIVHGDVSKITYGFGRTAFDALNGDDDTGILS